MSRVMIKVLRIKKRNLLLLLALSVFLLAVIVKTLPSGEDKSHITALSWAVVNKVIVIDPGHGGVDPGAVGKNGGVEKDITLQVSKRLAQLFSQAGVAVVLTRETDTDLSDPGGGSLLNRKRQDLSRRVAMADERKADLLLSIHVNSFISDPGQHGAQTFSQPGAEKSKEISRSIQEEIAATLKNTKRSPKEVDHYFVTRKSQVPAVIVEIGFITNTREEKLMMQPDYQSQMAWAIYKGVVKYYARQEENNGSTDRSKTIESFMHNPGNVNNLP